MTNEIDAFWIWFQQNSGKLLDIQSADDEAYEEFAQRLAELNPDIGVEIGGDFEGRSRKLVLTAYGDETLFPFVDQMASCAPKVDGWQVLALKPPLRQELQVEYNGASTVNISQVLIQPEDERSIGGKLPVKSNPADHSDCAESTFGPQPTTGTIESAWTTIEGHYPLLCHDAI